MAKLIEVYVSPDGDDRASGSRSRPVKSLHRAVALMRAKRKALSSPRGGRVVLRAGVHRLTRPLVLDGRDSGVAPTRSGNIATDVGDPLVFAAAPGEHAVISGGRRVTGWRQTTVHDRRAWVASLPAVRAGKWDFHQLWVNGRRAPRTRLPERGVFRIEKPLEDPGHKNLHRHSAFRGHRRFRFAPGDLTSWRNLEDVEFVALHFWIESRLGFAKIDVKRRVAELTPRPRMSLTDNYTSTGAPYYVENVYEALRRPGQWYLDRPAGRLIYLPRDGESIDAVEAEAPRLETLVKVRGAAHVRFEGLTFSHSEYVVTDDDRSATPQAACHVTGAVVFDDAQHAVMDRCTVEHVGGYGVEIINGSIDCAVTRCRLRDLGAGGVKVFHTMTDAKDRWTGLRGKASAWRPCTRVVVADNEITDAGHRHRQAVGVLVGRCSGVQVVHNHIHQLDYSGVSIGWTWGYADGGAYGNIVEHNHIHHIGRGVLSDMGGVYLLGVAPGTRVRYNRIHDVESRGYGGWGIYPDEGSSDLLIEHNLVYRTKSSGLHQHYGCDNHVRHNVFAFGGEGQARIGRVDAGRVVCRFHHNLFLSDGDGRMWEDKTGWMQPEDGPAAHLVSDRNLYFDLRGKAVRFAGRSWTRWKRLGMDRHSLVADPGFRDPLKGDFTLKKNAAAFKVGFIPFDHDDVGPRGPIGAPG